MLNFRFCSGDECFGDEFLHRDTCCCGQLLRRHSAGAIEHHRCLSGIEHGGLDADGGWACVENGVDASIEVGEDVCGGCRTSVAEEVGAGRGDRKPNGGQQGAGSRMRRNSYTDEVPAGGYGVGNPCYPWEQQGERSWPEGSGERSDARSELRWDARDAAKLLC